MTVGDVTRETGASSKALRGYEALKLVVPNRADNGYRMYDRHQVRVVAQIHRLNALGIPLADMHPFVDCLNAGSLHADTCPASLSGYRRAIQRVEQAIQDLDRQRVALVANLAEASARMADEWATADAHNPNLAPLPADLDVPRDDGATDHLAGLTMPTTRLPSTDGGHVDLAALGTGSVLIYVFPMTGAPGHDMPDGWDAIPGARGCSSHNCDMRNHYAELVQAGISAVYGLSSQPVEYQTDLVRALRLPYPLLTDNELTLHAAIGLPTFGAEDLTVYRRLALVVTGGIIEHVFYPVFPPDRHAQTVLDWLDEHPRPAMAPMRGSSRTVDRDGQ
ncbi:redoxin family protein [Rhodococcus fascians]|nr:redoxin family protein [Rhodococcus fascians]MBY3999159.1 redoxin family protein [Rhodococcus fascians]MBY4000235.1 redoxin family protein [Rhodococcus fascians]MBY4005263.1 redoxin family protein [Rhodococcus fascians]MBY4016913.1 redoxin family protein [Rhodococcus fascians]